MKPQLHKACLKALKGEEGYTAAFIVNSHAKARTATAALQEVHKELGTGWINTTQRTLKFSKNRKIVIAHKPEQIAGMALDDIHIDKSSYIKDEDRQAYSTMVR
jgi:hypothetical protein